MTEKEYNYKKPHGYDKSFNNKMAEFKPIAIERQPTKWDDLVDWMDTPHELSRSKVIFIASTIIFLAAPEFTKFIEQSGVPAFLKYYGAAILAGCALFVLTRSARR